MKAEEFLAGKGLVTHWERVRKNNHWLDALYNACAAGSFCGVRLIELPVPTARPKQKYGVVSEEPEAESYIDLERWDDMVSRWWD